jgi:phage terminase large subunit-like protein
MGAYHCAKSFGLAYRAGWGDAKIWAHGDDRYFARLGLQFSAAWSDELALWRRADLTWGILQSRLRLGDRPRQIVTTTPRAISLLARLHNKPTTVVSFLSPNSTETK